MSSVNREDLTFEQLLAYMKAEGAQFYIVRESAILSFFKVCPVCGEIKSRAGFPTDGSGRCIWADPSPRRLTPEGYLYNTNRWRSARKSWVKGAKVRLDSSDQRS
jgi:hypothetical protein